ncbi:RCC1 domain-containing protein [Paraliomyxa miuraensis]|uniref:RCC1 domain-containing protein n=1 Tax=Paraliomyxa miuraensis TaxID=376150 RepID=UPI00224D8E21|nr:DUF4215 domain-containing protein [Paraliomyxa miuraensis]MCX4240502.1 DUF4215 domain-containing protein [Paraliomyxa miuraensis]
MRVRSWLPLFLTSSTVLLASCTDDIPPVPVGDSSGSSDGSTTGVDTIDPDSTGSSTTTVDPDSTGSDGSTTSTDPDTTTGVTAMCGDGAVDDGEDCDDGNTDSDDGCSATCEQEAGFMCGGEPSTCAAVCGDGMVLGDELCDDGNTDVDDGCDDACMVEPGFSCMGEPSLCETGCGDGIVAGMEACDDGGIDDGDGCSAACAVEPGWACMGEPSLCSSTCGDGIVAGMETCDDGGSSDGDGCSMACAVEPGWSCMGEPSLCDTTCGDGVIAGTEVCDDGGVIDGDGCSSVCDVEPGFSCMGEPSLCSSTCGDGVIVGTEVCDDGDVIDGNGCSSLCDVEPGWSCMGEPSLCDTTCGDGIIAGTEQCDDNGLDPDDGCSAACVIEPGWFCMGEPSVCNTDCGDGLLAGTEQCDDANWAQGDGCDLACNIDFGWTCAGAPSVCSEVAVAEQVALGGFGGCVMTTLGDVGCFGDNVQGEVGNGTVNVETFLPSFATDDAIAITAGENHNCALRVGGDVLCWGDNSDSQLGPNSVPPIDEPLPIQVAGLPVAIALEAGDDFTCIIDTLNRVWCWGDNSNFNLGRGGASVADDPVPAQVALPGMLGATDLGMGDDHACVVLTNGTVACWGDDDNGQLGDGAGGADRSTAALVPGLTGIVDVEGGLDTTCALDNLGQVYCWGDNADGQLGVGNTMDSANPQMVTLPSAAETINLGDDFSCALLLTDQVFCWGESEDFQTGYGDIFDALVPTEVVGLPALNLVDLEAGGGAGGVCVLSAGGDRWCWGYSEEGQLGIASLGQLEPAPVDLTGPVASLVLDPPEYRGVLCGVMTDGTIQCSGNNTLVSAAIATGAIGILEPITGYQATPVTHPLLADVQSLALGNNFACAATTTSVQCWGDNSNRQLGQGGVSTVDIPTPVAVVGLGAVDELEVGGEHACVRTGGTVQCWGDNSDFQSGVDGVTTDQSLPVTVMGIADAVDIALGEDHGCAVRATGVVSCWGNDANGQLGDDDGDATDSGIPVDVTGLPPGVTSVVAGQDHSCALAGGMVYCWGENQYGNLGQGNQLDVDMALPVPGLTGIVQISAGWNYNCALDGAGDMWCWGYGLDGQLGNGGQEITGFTQFLSPVPFEVASGIINVVAGNSTTCIETLAGWSCVGFRASGQLGNGTAVELAYPADTLFGP